MLRRSLCLLVLSASCIGGQTGTPTSDEGRDVDLQCDEPADAATALGVRGVDLWEAFEGEYMVNVFGQLRNGDPLPYPEETFKIHVTRDESLHRPAPCNRVEVLVRVSWRGNSGLAGEAVASLSLQGSPTRASIILLEPEDGRPPAHGTGSLVIQAGTVTNLNLAMWDTVWFLPPPEEDP